MSFWLYCNFSMCCKDTYEKAATKLKTQGISLSSVKSDSEFICLIWFCWVFSATSSSKRHTVCYYAMPKMSDLKMWHAVNEPLVWNLNKTQHWINLDVFNHCRTVRETCLLGSERCARSQRENSRDLFSIYQERHLTNTWSCSQGHRVYKCILVKHTARSVFVPHAGLARCGWNSAAVRIEDQHGEYG